MVSCAKAVWHCNVASIENKLPISIKWAKSLVYYNCIGVQWNVSHNLVGNLTSYTKKRHKWGMEKHVRHLFQPLGKDKLEPINNCKERILFTVQTIVCWGAVRLEEDGLKDFFPVAFILAQNAQDIDNGLIWIFEWAKIDFFSPSPQSTEDQFDGKW